MEENKILEERLIEGNEMSSFHRDKKKSILFGWKKLFLFFLTYLAASFILGVIIAIPFAIINIANGNDGVEEILASHWLLYIDAVALIISLLIFKSARLFLKGLFSFKQLKQAKTYLYLGLAFVILFGSQFIIMNVLSLEKSEDQIGTFGLNDLSFQWWNLVLFYIAFTVITPIKEEILFRGLLYRFLDKKIHFWVGFIVSSLIFGVLHSGHMISATIMGMVFVGLYKLTKSLIVPITFHILWNLYAITGLLLFM